MNLKGTSSEDSAKPNFDDGFVKIYPYKKAVVVEKYKETEITGEQQQLICNFITEHYGLARIGIVVRSVKYGMSMEAMMLLKDFMKQYSGPFAFVDPLLHEGKTVVSDYSNGAYLNNKVEGTYASLQIAYEELSKTS